MRAVPFVVGQWVRGERFYGRAAHVSEILEGHREAIWLLGTRRIGKTSLLRQLERLTASKPERGFFPLFWDLQGSAEPEELHLGFADALLDAEDRLEELGLDVAELEADDLFTSLGRLRRRLRAQQLRLLLLCDEVEELIELYRKDPALLRKLRHALQAAEEIRSVLASTVRLWDLTDERGDTSPFLHGFTPPLYVSTLTDDEARSLVQQDQLPKQARPGFDQQAAEMLRERCDNHPYLLQILSKRYLETGDLEEATELVATDRMVSYFFSVDFELLELKEREILQLIAQQTAAASDTIGEALSLDAASVAGALQTLEGLGFIGRDAGGRFVLRNYFFRRWLTERPVDDGERQGAGRTPSETALSTLDGEASALIDGRYELLRTVGEGATGVVHEAFDRLLKAKVAIKILRSEYAGNRAVLERFRKEILLSRDLGHPNILRVYHLGEVAGRAYLTMQWAAGPTLAAWIAEEAPLPAPTVVDVGAKLASALEAAHLRKVLHRDIKPHNILLNAAGEPLIADFGLARLLGRPSGTIGGVFLGTPNYVSPEQADMRDPDGRSDVYALGVVLFEMATGRCPFQAESVAEVLEMHRSVPPPDPRDLVPELPPELGDIILRCLEKDPGQRFPDATALRTAIESLQPEGAARDRATAIVSHLGEAEEGATAEDLLPLVYQELRRLARGFLARERPEHTLQPTALVHEAYLRLMKQSRVDWRGRSHFFAVSARVMRRLLIDHARTRGRLKRGGHVQRVTLMEEVTPGRGRELELDELLQIDTALDELSRANPRQAQIVELRFFAGMTVEEVAEHLGVSKRTVESDWTAARTWLQQKLSTGDSR